MYSTYSIHLTPSTYSRASMYSTSSTYSTRSAHQIPNSDATTNDSSSLSLPEDDKNEVALRNLYSVLVCYNNIFEKKGLDLNNFMNYLVMLVETFTLFGTENRLITLNEFKNRNADRLISHFYRDGNLIYGINPQESIKQYCIAILNDICQFHPSYKCLPEEISKMICNLNNIITNFKLMVDFKYST